MDQGRAARAAHRCRDTVKEVAMEGLRVIVNCIVVGASALIPAQFNHISYFGNNNLGGGMPVATLVHGGPAPTDISSAFMPDTQSPSAVMPTTQMESARATPAWRWQSTIEPDANNFQWKFGAAVSIHERSIAIGPARDWDLCVDQTGVRTYTLAGQHWLCDGAISHPSGDVHAQFGVCVALKNKMLLIGSPRDSDGAFETGAAFLYIRVGQRWDLQATLKRSVCNAADQFGAAIACDENTLVIGAPKADEGVIDSGAVEVFERDQNGWRNVATLVSNPPRAGALFGLSVALDSGRIIVGAPGDKSDGNFSGRAFIYTRGATGWVLDAELSCPSGTRGWFGSAVAGDQSRVLIGAPRLVRPNQTDLDARGMAFEYRRSSDGWHVAATIMPANAREADSFGCSLALHQHHAVFGASIDSLAGRMSGAAFAGVRNSLNQWSVERLVAPDAAPEQLAGHVVGIFGSRIIVGRMGNPEEDPALGAVSVFVIAPPRIAHEDGRDTSSTRVLVKP